MSGCLKFNCTDIFRNYDAIRWGDNNNSFIQEAAENGTWDGVFGNFSRAPALQANADISGIGVVVSFVVTGYITLFLAIFCYLFLPEPSTLSLVDRCAIRLFTTTGSNRNSSIERWRKPVTALLLAFSDQQIVTGFALIISGIYQLNCGISAYHWQMLLYLAWFSTVSHLATITVLRGHFLKNRWIGYVRISLMTTLGVLLVFAILPTGAGFWLPLRKATGGSDAIIIWPETLGIPAKCYLEAWIAMIRGVIRHRDLYGIYGGYNIFYKNGTVDEISGFGFDPAPSTQHNSMVFGILLLVINFAFKTTRISHCLTSITTKFARGPPEKIVLYLSNSQRLRATRRPAKLVYCGFLNYFLVIDFLGSMYAELLFILNATWWGSIKLFSTRPRGDPLVREQENFLGFGQFLPCILLILPFLSAWESIYEVLHELPEQPDLSPDSNATALGNEPCDAPLARNSQIRNNTSSQSKYSELGLAPANEMDLGIRDSEAAASNDNQSPDTASMTILNIESSAPRPRSLHATHPKQLTKASHERRCRPDQGATFVDLSNRIHRGLRDDWNIDYIIFTGTGCVIVGCQFAAVFVMSELQLTERPYLICGLMTVAVVPIGLTFIRRHKQQRRV